MTPKQKAKVIGFLNDILTLYKPRGTWIRGYVAARHVPYKSQLNDTFPTDPESDLSGCWCLTGAVECVVRRKMKRASQVRQRIAMLLEEEIGKTIAASGNTVTFVHVDAQNYAAASSVIIAFNDILAGSKRDIVKVVKKTIARLEATP